MAFYKTTYHPMAKRSKRRPPFQPPVPIPAIMPKLPVIFTSSFSYTKKIKSFVAYDSEINGFSAGKSSFILKNPKTQKWVVFEFCGWDMDGDEVGGWKYKSKGFTEQLYCLIIND